MEEVGWSQAGVWRSERDHFINDDIMLGVTDTYIFNEFLLNILRFRLCICTTESSIQKMAETCILWHPGHKVASSPGSPSSARSIITCDL